MPTTTRPTRYRVTFTISDVAPFVALGGVFDMLRYEGCVVESWDQERRPGRHGTTYTLELAGGVPPAVDRWRSFGFSVAELPR